MNLAIDIGNSLAKLAVIENGQVVDFLKTDRPDAAFVAGVLDANPAIDAAIAISCRTAHACRFSATCSRWLAAASR